MMQSWWIGLSRDELHAAVLRETDRMENAKGKQFYVHSAWQFPDPPRKRTAGYTYALDGERDEA